MTAGFDDSERFIICLENMTSAEKGFIISLKVNEMQTDKRSLTADIIFS